MVLMSNGSTTLIAIKSICSVSTRACAAWVHATWWKQRDLPDPAVSRQLDSIARPQLSARNAQRHAAAAAFDRFEIVLVLRMVREPSLTEQAEHLLAMVVCDDAYLRHGRGWPARRKHQGRCRRLCRFGLVQPTCVRWDRHVCFDALSCLHKKIARDVLGEIGCSC